MPAQPFQSRRRTSLSSPTRAAFGVSAVALGLGILPMSPASAAPQLYVSPAGSDVACDGSSPAAWTGSGQTCALQSIGAAIQAAEAGATIDVLAGVYVENVVVDKSVAIVGEGAEQVVVVPAFSNPDCEGDSLCGGEASSIVLVRASGVQLSGLTLDGDNPALESGVVVNGADVDARNGVITDRPAGIFDDLVVTDLVVQNVWLRGIYASSGGTFDFERNHVRNVMGISGSSVALLNFEGSGIMADNTVEYAYDALVSNHSHGVQFLRNTVYSSGSGVHTDNAGDGGGEADLISGNSVSSCLEQGYGVWVFMPYLAPTVEENEIRDCSIGLGVFGGQVGVEPRFVNNRVDGGGREDSRGIVITNDLLGWGSADTEARFQHNRIENNAIGVEVLQEEGLSSSATLHLNWLKGNGVGVTSTTGAAVDARLNWWGCRQGPESSRCDSVEGDVDYTPWLGQHLSGASPSSPRQDPSLRARR